MTSSTQNRYDNCISLKENISRLESNGKEVVSSFEKEDVSRFGRSNAVMKRKDVGPSTEGKETRKKRRVLGDISNRQPNSANTEKTRKEIEKPKRVDDIQSMKEKKFGVSQPSPTALDLKQSKVTDTAPRKSNMGSIVEEDEVEFSAGGLSPLEDVDDDLKLLEDEIKASLEECKDEFWDFVSKTGDDGEAAKVIDPDFAREAGQSPLPEIDQDEITDDDLEAPDTYADNFVDDVQSQFFGRIRCDPIVAKIVDKQ
ncbi:hypothetical protein ABG067_006350 [Albugo candida]